MSVQTAGSYCYPDFRPNPLAGRRATPLTYSLYMEVVYSRKVRGSLATKKSRRLAYPNNHRHIAMLLSALSKVENVREMTMGKPHPLKGNRQGQLAISVGRALRMVLTPGPDDPQYGAKRVNWRAVKQIQIVDITDYHR